jgi:hypothetical protein
MIQRPELTFSQEVGDWVRNPIFGKLAKGVCLKRSAQFDVDRAAKCP